MIHAVVSLVFRAAPLLSFFAAAWVVGRIATHDAPDFGLRRTAVVDLTSAIAFAAFAAARLAAALPHWRVTVAHPLDLLRVTDHLSLTGGAVGAAGGLALVSWRAGLPVIKVADLYGAALPIGVATHGVGCLLREDCYGREAPSPIGIVFPGLRTPRYPVELYAAAFALLAYFGVQQLRRRLPPGGVAAVAVAVLAASRAMLDGLRLDTSDRLLSNDQAVSLAIAGLGIAALGAVWLWTKRPLHDNPMIGTRVTLPGVVDRR